MEHREEHVFFSSGPLELEGVVSIPTGDSTRPGVIVCHPHPLYGGDMYNNVVTGVAAALADGGCVVLRFNFRGVSQSEGRYAEGVGEVDDAIAAARYLSEQKYVSQGKLASVGYSFGAWIGLKAASKYPNIRAAVAISPPLSVYDFSIVAELEIPILVVSGGDDHLCPAEALDSMYDNIKSPKERSIFKGVDHFFQDSELKLGECVRKFLCCHL